MTTDYPSSTHNRMKCSSTRKVDIAAAMSPYAAASKSNSTEITGVSIIRLCSKSDRRPVGEPYIELITNENVSGFGGPLYTEQASSLETLLPLLRKLLIGRDPVSSELNFEWIWSRLHPDKPLSVYASGVDPLTGKTIWNTRRKARHTATGNVISAMGEVDNALWDIRGKLASQPICRLLGRKREKLRAYISTVPGDDIAETRKQARKLFDDGHTAQKWFFCWGPPDGKAGFAKVVGLVEGLRDELGEKAKLMYDFHVGSRGRCDWDVAYATKVATAIRPFDPTWLEEPFSPEEIDSYRRLKGETDIPLATGEHTYSRWNIKPFLDEKLVSYVQSDPEWCGGISELLKICELASNYENVRVIPHGHHVLAAAHVVASQPESLCPMVEHGPAWLSGRQQAQTRSISPVSGYLSTPNEPGLGPSIDWKRFERL